MLPVDGARLAALASGRGGPPVGWEWPVVVVALLALGVVGTRVLRSVGLSWGEAFAVAGLAPLLVAVDLPVGVVGAGALLAANVAGCLIPVAVGVKVLGQGRVPWLEAFVVVGVAIVVSFLASRVVAGRGVMLHYRLPVVATALMAAALLFRAPFLAGVAGFAAGGLGVLVGADLARLPELSLVGESGRIVLGGAGLLDGIFLAAVLGGAASEGLAHVLRVVAAWSRRSARAAA